MRLVIDNLKIRKGKDMMKVEICEVVRCYQEDKEMRCKFGNDDECSLQGAVKRMPNSIDENMKAVMEEVIRPLEVAYAKPIRIVEGFVCPRRCNLGGDKRLWLHVKGDTVLIQAVELESHELRFENLEIARAIVKNGRFDEMVLEDVHAGGIEPKAIRVSYKRNGGNRQVVKKRVKGQDGTEELSGLDLEQLTDY